MQLSFGPQLHSRTSHLRCGRWHVASTAAKSAALNGLARPRPPSWSSARWAARAASFEPPPVEPGVEAAEGAGVGAAGVCGVVA